MIVTCPHCSTRYNIEETRLAGPSPMLKCSRCRRVFPAPTVKKQAPSPSPKSSSSDAENLKLPFEEPAWKDEPTSASADLEIPEQEDEGYTLEAEGPADALVVPPDVAAEPGATPRKRERSAARSTPVPPTSTPAEHRPATRAANEEDSDALIADHVDDAVDEEAETDDLSDREPSAPAAPRRRKAARSPAARRPAARDSERGKVWALMIFLGAVLASYWMLTRALFASPQLCDNLLSRIPLIGLLGDDRLLTRKVALSEVAGGYQRIKDGKQVFVITGKALNTAPVALHDVQIAGKLFNSEGAELDEKIIFCGNAISTKEIGRASCRERVLWQG